MDVLGAQWRWEDWIHTLTSNCWTCAEICIKYKNPFDQNITYILHIKGLEEKCELPEQLEGFGEGFYREQSMMQLSQFLQKNWLDVLMTKNQDYIRTKCIKKKKKRDFLIAVGSGVGSGLNELKGCVFTGKATKCNPGMQALGLQSWLSQACAPLTGHSPEHPPSLLSLPGHHSSRQQNYRKQQNMSQRIHMFVNILKTSIPSCFWVSRECNFKVQGLIWLSTKFAWGLVGRGKKKSKKLTSVLKAKIKCKDKILRWEVWPFRIDHEFYFPCHWTGLHLRGCWFNSFLGTSLTKPMWDLSFLFRNQSYQSGEGFFFWFFRKINELLGPMTAPGLMLQGEVSVVQYHWGSGAANPHQKMQTQYWECSLHAMFGFSQLNPEQKLSCFCFVLFPTGKSRRLLPCL